MTVPWKSNTPLMLAPMQGLTNRALRSVYGRTVKPDVLFTEFVRIRPGAKHVIAPSDIKEAMAEVPGIPLVIQVIGCPDSDTVEATKELIGHGVRDININMGCPWGRMTSVLAGGGMFRAPETIEPFLRDMRKIVPGSLSIKTRLGIDDDGELLPLLPLFENGGVDFLITHARTVKQKYKGVANHVRTRELVEAAPFPVIANGDIHDAAKAEEVLASTGAAGLMLGRGAIADPWLFERIRGRRESTFSDEQAKAELTVHLQKLLLEYSALFHGDTQVLSKFREVLAHISNPALKQWVKKLKKRKYVEGVVAILAEAH